VAGVGTRWVVLPALLALVCVFLIAGRSAPALPARPNILLILTDDQRFDELDHMATVQSELIDRGVEFAGGMVSNPLCCPSRATILTGTYSHTNRIYSNRASSKGGFHYFNDGVTIATTLRDAGYHTGLIGKYLNEYDVADASYVPPGWDRWFGVTTLRYYGFSASDQGVPVTYDDDTYMTDVLGQQAVDFVQSAPEETPLFLYWAPYAPHPGAQPAEKYEGTLAGLAPLRPDSYNEKDVSDKPAYVQSVRRWTPATEARWDLFREHQEETLLSVDDWVAQILQALANTGRLDNTLIVFMSDNGFLLGEHRLVKKMVPYDESIRVPFVVRWDAAGWTPGTQDQHLVANVDLATTFATAAGTTMPGSEGLDLLGLLADPTEAWRQALVLEHAGQTKQVPAYCGLREPHMAYYQYSTGEEELYDLASDPYELDNRAGDASYEEALVTARKLDHRLCHPRPPHFRWTH
jgi:N-acetylglucosamine-6-sulfatase